MDDWAKVADLVPHLSASMTRARKAQGLSLRGVARETGVSFSTLWRLEQGERVSMEVALKVARWLSSSQDGEEANG